MVWSAVTSVLGRLWDWKQSFVYECSFIVDVMPWGWPVLLVETTIHNRSIAPLYVSGFEVLSEPLLNLGMGKPTDVQMSGFERRGNSITFPERQIDPGEKLSLDFILYPNWQMLALDFPQPQPGRPGHSAGIVATFQT